MNNNNFLDDGWIIEVDITHRCNLKCRHCNRLCNAESTYNTHRIIKDMDDCHIEYLCSQIKKQPVGKVKKIRILGGEPLLSPILENSIRSFEALRTDGLIKEIVVMTNGTVPVPNYLQPYIIHFPPKIQDETGVDGTIAAREVYAIKEEKHVNISVSPADLGLTVDRPCNRYIGCGIHYSIYGFSLSAPCFPTLFVFQSNHRYFIHYLPSSIEGFIDKSFAKDVCSNCVYGMRLLGYDTDKISNFKIGVRWGQEIILNSKNGFIEPNTSWIKNAI